MSYEDKTLTCVECGNTFTYTADDQQFHASKGYTEPKRCPTCRANRRASGGGGGYGGSARHRCRTKPPLVRQLLTGDFGSSSNAMTSRSCFSKSLRSSSMASSFATSLAAERSPDSSRKRADSSATWQALRVGQKYCERTLGRVSLSILWM